jgi:hypothetical protein
MGCDSLVSVLERFIVVLPHHSRGSFATGLQRPQQRFKAVGPEALAADGGEEESPSRFRRWTTMGSSQTLNPPFTVSQGWIRVILNI